MLYSKNKKLYLLYCMSKNKKNPIAIYTVEYKFKD